MTPNQLEVEKEKIVIDTSLWIANLLTGVGGAGGAAIKKALENYTPVGSRETMQELERKLLEENPKLDQRQISKEERARVFEFAKSVTKELPVTENQQLCRDPKDDKFINLAIASGAKQIVTFDKDLTVLEKVQGISMLKAKEFLERERQLDNRREPFLNQKPDTSEQKPTQPAEHKPEQKRESTAERLARQVRERELQITIEQTRKLKP